MYILMWFIVLTIAIIIIILKSNMLPSYIVPKIIHQTAPADESKWNPVWKPCQMSWKRNFPDWEYRMWTDEDLDQFIKTKYAWFYPTYISYPKNIMRIDAARYFILYEYGGIYADMDFECVKNFEMLLPKGLAFAAETPWRTPGEVYQNALMGSPAKHEFWVHVFEDLVDHKDNGNILQATGPEVIHRVAVSHAELFYPLRSKNFAPPFDDSIALDHNISAISIKEKHAFTMKRFYSKADEHVYTRHHGSCEWCVNDPPSKLKSKKMRISNRTSITPFSTV